MYKHHAGGYLNIETGQVIPVAADNAQYQMLLDWIAKGGVVGPEFTLEQRRANAIETLKSDATSMIYEVLSEVKQRNELARIAELTLKEIGGGLTTDEQSELAAIQAKWNEIKAIRALSNSKESEVMVSNNPESITMAS